MATTLGPEAADEFVLYYDEAAEFADLTFAASNEASGLADAGLACMI